MRFKYVEIEITTRCNLACDYCFSLAEGGVHTNEDMSLSVFGTILKQVKGLSNFLLFVGMGESFMHPNIEKILSQSKQEGFDVGICTNLTMVNKDALKMVDTLVVSIDAIKEAPYNPRNGFDPRSVISNLFKMTKSDYCPPELKLYVTVTQKNYEHIADVFEVADRFANDLHGVIVAPMLDLTSHENMLTIEQRAHLKQIMKNYPRVPFEGPLIMEEDIDDCGWLDRLLYFNVEGKLGICPMRSGSFDEFYDLITEVSLENQLKMPAVMAMRSDLKNQEYDQACKNCIFNGTHKCFHV